MLMPPILDTTGLIRRSSILSSRIFDFDVSENAKSFAIHSLLISKSSPEFNAMMSSQMKEGIEGRVRLEQVDHHTFIRFVEYLYGNNYNAAKASIVQERDEHKGTLGNAEFHEPTADEEVEATPNDDPPSEPVEVVEDDWTESVWAPKKTKHKKNPRKQKRFPSLEALADFALPPLGTEFFPRFHNVSARNDVDLMYCTTIQKHFRMSSCTALLRNTRSKISRDSR